MRDRALGKMRHRLQIKTIARTRDAGGGYARADTDGDLVWGRVATLSAREMAVYDQLQKRITHKAIVRRNSGLVQGVTVVWQRPDAHGGDMSLYIESAVDADPDKPGEFMQLLMREGGQL